MHAFASIGSVRYAYQCVLCAHECVDECIRMQPPIECRLVNVCALSYDIGHGGYELGMNL